jgi:hypothetical protein
MTKNKHKETTLSEEDKVLARMSIDDIITDDLPDEIEVEDDANATLTPNSNAKKKFTSMRDKCATKARNTLTAMLKFYLDEDIINVNEYVNTKVALERESLARLIYLMESAEDAMTSLLANIEGGDTHPRMYEVLGQLQKNILDMVKSQTMFMLATEDSVKKLGRDAEIYSGYSTTKKVGNGNGAPAGGISSRGTKDLMRAIQDINRQNAGQPVEEAVEIPEPTKPLQNPIVSEDIDDDDDFEDTLSQELDDEE